MLKLESEPALYSDDWLLSLYLQYGSVESVLSEFDYSLPVSVSDYHRLVKKRGMVKGEGRANASLAQTLYVFLNKTLDPNLSIERVYRSIPLSIRTKETFPALATIYRVYQAVLEGKTNKQAVGLVISPPQDFRKILLVDEKITNTQVAKKQGDSTIPVGFTPKNMSADKSILRVMQREFSNELAINGKLALDERQQLTDFARKIIPSDISPFLTINILDIKLHIFHLVLPLELVGLKSCTSATVENHRFMDTQEILESGLSLRPGISDVLRAFNAHLMGEAQARQITSKLNLALMHSY